ncbi:Stp1/IreP family PP2C-type Ser/Thr phosphatase [Pseudogracilibacillus auburnensis]|uniref:protein-serine/threonine phosphatase n=1 Tax=Pseudogracilibacillus auburnensis TaxID=1494959 RepID=A0A2V3WID1_9BACI|nr:Stp1/IreP family PP2C-type Ser/Thr phosphatase [Pseudogracilibacillus auburnensis]PXW88559.1 protein phosphatase [Pseudogracilibacillus auburnensis]
MDGQFITDRGQMRSTNEDSGGIFFNESGQALAIVADGMGGHQAGEVASQLAVSIVQDKWEQSNRFSTPIEAEEWLQAAVEEMNKMIYKRSLEHEEFEGMGTTVVISICTFDFVTIAHIGDSRCYLLNDTKLEQLTEDHSLVNELIRTGQISKIDAEQHPRKNVLLRAVGTEESVNMDMETINWDENNCLLLCSDGLTNKIPDDEIETYLRTKENLEEVSNKLIQVANERGGEDNITLAIIRNVLEDEVGETTC